MTELVHWDTVLSKNNTWCNLVAYVDMVVDDKAYISEWWKNLANPYRLVVRKDALVKYDRTNVTISKAEFLSLLKEHFDITWTLTDADVLPKEWESFSIPSYWTMVCIWEYDNDNLIFKWNDDRFYIIKKEELKWLKIDKEKASQMLFGISYDNIIFTD